MTIALSKITSQGQISVPAPVRKKLGLAPGSVLEWVESGGEVLVRKAVRHSSADVHQALFASTGAPTSDLDVKEAIRKHIRRRHARD